jgi:hypothetical protein
MQQQLFGGGTDSGCLSTVHVAIGTSNAFRVYAYVDSDGSHVIALLLNGRIIPGDPADAAGDASLALYCES